MKALVMIFVLVSLATGCSSNYHSVEPQIIPTNSPPENKVSVVNIGESILHQAAYHRFKAIQLHKELSRRFGCYNATAGWYINVSADNDFDYYKPAPSSGEGAKVYVGGGLCVGWVDAIKREIDSGDLCLRNHSMVDLCDDDDDFTLTTLDLLRKNSVQKSLIYNGMVGNKVNFAYREYGVNSNASYFSNNVEYDLNESKIIGYKGAQIEILKATNRYLQFKVLKHFQ